VLHKKAILVERGRFRPVTHVNVDMMRAAREEFSRVAGVPPDQVVELMEITMQNLSGDGGQIDHRDFLARADVLGATGANVLVSDYFEYYRLAAYLARYTKQKIAITMGGAALRQLFDEKYYSTLDGGILESFGRLFKNDLKLYVYPYRDLASGEFKTIDNIDIPQELRKLYGYLVDKGCIEQLKDVDDRYLHIFSDDVLKKIKQHDASWREMVPTAVAEMIEKRCLFGFRREPKYAER
jgi:hypothetical protein